jgi:hypothetical protein
MEECQMNIRRKNRWWLFAVALILGLVALSAGAPGVAADGKWYGEYFSNPSLSGGPTFTRYDDRIYFEWRTGSPGDLPDDNFSVRWTRDEWFEAGLYRFSYYSDDGIRIWVGDTLVVDDWRDRQAEWDFVDHYIPRGTHTVRVEYYERTGAARLQVGWERVGPGEAWRGEYFDNRELEGGADLTRNDAAIDFDWGYGRPADNIPADYFSVRWTRTLGFTAGTYRFYASCDDGVRIFVDGALVVDAWQDQKLPNTHSGDIALSAGRHTVVVEYYEHGGEASAHVWWKRLDGFSGWQGRYYSNTELRGGPELVRDDAAINFDWGEGAPADWMPTDSFSAVWTREVTFSPGYYRFNVRSDDGVRVWLDDRLLMDYWEPMDYEWHYVDGTYLEGTHQLKVEYFEGAGGARIRFWWEPSDTAPSPAAPATPAQPSPTPTPDPGLPGPWQAAYFDNRTLAGDPVVTRQDEAIDFDWGWDGPAASVPRDDFSVRWRGTFGFEGGRYRFRTLTDDGVRLYVDDQRLISAWYPMRGTRVGYVTLSPGQHVVRVEYFERLQAARARVTWERIGAAP